MTNREKYLGFLLLFFLYLSLSLWCVKRFYNFFYCNIYDKHRRKKKKKNESSKTLIAITSPPPPQKKTVHSHNTPLSPTEIAVLSYNLSSLAMAGQNLIYPRRNSSSINILIYFLDISKSNG